MIKIGVMDYMTERILQELVTQTDIVTYFDISQPLDILIASRVFAYDHAFSQRIIIANSDDRDVLQCISPAKACIITYGLNPKAAITASSHIEDGKYVICVQRAMTTIGNMPVLPHEFTVKIKDCQGYDESALGAIAAALICGVNFD